MDLNSHSKKNLLESPQLLTQATHMYKFQTVTYTTTLSTTAVDLVKLTRDFSVLSCVRVCVCTAIEV